MKNWEDLIAFEKVKALLEEKKEDEQCKQLLWLLAIIGAVAVIAGIAVAVYRYLAPDYLDDIEDDFEDDFFEDEDDEEEEESKEEEEAKAEDEEKTEE